MQLYILFCIESNVQQPSLPRQKNNAKKHSYFYVNIRIIVFDFDSSTGSRALNVSVCANGAGNYPAFLQLIFFSLIFCERK